NFFSNVVFESMRGYEKVLMLFKKHDVKLKRAECLLSLATNYSKIGQEPKSMEYMHKATMIFIYIIDTIGIMIDYRSIGLLYKRQKDNLRALEYLNKALEVSKNLNDTEATIHLLISLASMYKITDELDRSLGLYFEALKLSEKTDHLLTKATLYS